MTDGLKEYRCKNCKKLLCKGVLIESVVEIKCKACGELSTFKGEPASKYMCLVYPCPNRVTAEDTTK
jgi:phage FluMu protein Com